MGLKETSLLSEITPSAKMKSAFSFAFSLVYGLLVLFSVCFCFAIPNVLILFTRVFSLFIYGLWLLESHLERFSQSPKLGRYSQLAFFILLYSIRSGSHFFFLTG